MITPLLTQLTMKALWTSSLVSRSVSSPRVLLSGTVADEIYSLCRTAAACSCVYDMANQIASDRGYK